MRSASMSDRGLVRENNEDRVLADEAHGIFLLADGMGGGPGGEIASELAVTAAHGLLVRNLPGKEAGETGPILADALAAAHSAVAKRSVLEPALLGMGTTLEMVVLKGAEVTFCHVGDSRIYHFREGTLYQLTTDDNYAALFNKNRMLPAGGMPARFKHILTQAVGVSDDIIPEIRSIHCDPGDLLLLCSDGLTEALADEEIADRMRRNYGGPEAIAKALISAANDKGGPDNVSVVVIDPLP